MNKDKVFYFTGIFKTVEDDEIAQDYVAEVDCHINNLAPEGFVDLFNLIKDEPLQDKYGDVSSQHVYDEDDRFFWDGDYYYDISSLIQDYPEYFTVDYAEVKGDTVIGDDDINLNDVSFVTYFQMTITLYIVF